MKDTQKLAIINAEPNPQKRLKFLVDNGFLGEASALIWNLVHSQTAMFHYDWHCQSFCAPLPRVTDKTPGVYVMITTRDNFDYNPFQRKEGEQHIIFELGWETKVLRWSLAESRLLVTEIAAQALARPINQWSLKQTEGMARAARQMLSPLDPTAQEVAAFHLIYHLRKADFGHISNYLSEIDGFPFKGAGWSSTLNVTGMVNWIIDQLLKLGWTEDRIRKELLEWIWLKVDTWPQWLLGVAKAKVFAEDDLALAVAVKRWVLQKTDYLLDTVHGRSDQKEMTAAFLQLFKIGRFNHKDKDWFKDKLARQIASGKVKSARFFTEEFAGILGLDSFSRILSDAIRIAVDAGDFGIAAKLRELNDEKPDPAWLEIIQLRQITTTLE